MKPVTREEEPHAFDGVIPPKKDAPADTEQAVDRAQAAADQVADLMSGSEGGSDDANRPSLDEMDAAIAEDADGVIESVFASVEDLLGESLSDEDLARGDEPIEAESAATEEDAAVLLDEQVLQSLVGEVADEEGEEPGEAAVDQAAEEPEHDDDDVVAASEPAPEPGAALAMKDDQPAEDDAPKTVEAAPRFALVRRILQVLAGLFQQRKLIAMVATLLAVISWPLRFVPEGARPYVDWFALSLVFWIPVIWVVAVFIVGR